MKMRFNTGRGGVPGALATLVMAAGVAGCIHFSKPNASGGVLFSDEVVRELLSEEPVVIPGVILLIDVMAGGNPVLPAQTKLVSMRNEISMPLLGVVDCRDLTLMQLTDKLEEAYSELYQDPVVAVSFAPENNEVSPWGFVGVYGCVMREGIVNITKTRQLTLSLAIQMSGGLTPVANKKNILVTRTAKDGTQQSKDFNYYDISSGKIKDPLLVPNDAILVKETFL